MEGILHVPPDRGTIIGRALWKPRYVVVGALSDTRQRQQSQQIGRPPAGYSKPTAPTCHGQQSQPPRAPTPRSPSSLSPETMYISIFKAKGDFEPIQQHAITSITECQVQMLAHRKQGHVLPTLVINISPDPVTDKLRKRRSSRTAGLTSTKETSPTTLWFRPGEDNHQKHILQDWCRYIQSLMFQLGSTSAGSTVAGSGPLSPITPASPTFTNPFAPSQRSRDASDLSFQQLQQSQYAQRPGSDNNAGVRAGALSHKTSSQTNQTFSSRERDRPKTYSESPSLRSRRSDLSHASSNLPPHITTPGYSANSSNNNFALPFFQNRPADLPSPATTVNEFQGDLIEGWTSAQGRSSALGSPVLGRESFSSQPPLPTAPAAAAALTAKPAAVINSSSPPAPRETILDRAFQLRFIPGSDREVPGEEKLSSLARFDALMREAEERKRLRQALATSDVDPSAGAAAARPEMQPKSGWDLDDDDDESDVSGRVDDEDEDETDSDAHSDSFSSEGRSHVLVGGRTDGLNIQQHDHLDPAVDIDPSARRALDFIAGRHRDGRGSRTPSSALAQMQSSQPMSSSALRGYEAPPALPKGFAGNMEYDAETLRTLDSGYYPFPTVPSQQQQPIRPQTGYARNRPAFAQRTHSQPQLAALNISNFAGSNQYAQKHARLVASPTSPTLPPPLPRASTSSKIDELRAKTAAGTPPSTSASLHRSSTATAVISPSVGSASAGATLGKRQSSSSIKRLSFTEITKRLSSSTSSLLLVQTNTSSNSGSGSVIHEGECQSPMSVSNQRGEKLSVSYSYANPHGAGHQQINPTSRLASPPPPPPPSAERYSWRGSVGVLSAEGGFL